MTALSQATRSVCPGYQVGIDTGQACSDWHLLVGKGSAEESQLPLSTLVGQSRATQWDHRDSVCMF